MRMSMRMTLRWAERSKRYFEAHKDEVPWGSGQLPLTRGGQPQVPRRLAARNDNSEISGNPGEKENVSLAGPRGEQGSPGQTVASALTQNQALFGIVQGGMDLQLRKESAERTVAMGFPGYAIGGLSVGEPRDLTREVVEATLEHLPADKPRYLMGVGTPEEIALYAGLGVDMMDCVLPTRAARHGLLFTSEGKVSIKQARYASDPGPLDPACACRVCQRYSRAYLRHLYAANEVLAQVLNTVHNLSFYLDTMRRVRHSIRLGEGTRPLSGVSSQPKP